MAFRTGHHVAALAERLCPQVEQSESWTYIVSGVTENEALLAIKTFHETNVSHRSFKATTYPKKQYLT